MIKKDDIEHIANLSRIGLEPKEKESLQKDLSGILDYIEKLKELDITQVSSRAHSLNVCNVTRGDTPKVSPFKEEVINLFTEKDGKFLKVRSVKESFSAIDFKE